MRAETSSIDPFTGDKGGLTSWGWSRGDEMRSGRHDEGGRRGVEGPHCRHLRRRGSVDGMDDEGGTGEGVAVFGPLVVWIWFASWLKDQ